MSPPAWLTQARAGEARIVRRMRRFIRDPNVDVEIQLISPDSAEIGDARQHRYFAHQARVELHRRGL